MENKLEKIYGALIRRQDDLDRIIDHYGAKLQQNKLIEELMELIMAHVNNWTKGIREESFLNEEEESADVLIVLSQLMLEYMDENDISSLINYKIDRTLKRMEVLHGESEPEGMDTDMQHEKEP